MIYVNDVLIFFYSLTFLYDVIFFLLLFINLLFFYIKIHRRILLLN